MSYITYIIAQCERVCDKSSHVGRVGSRARGEPTVGSEG